jgi:hypothetical protein
VCLEYSAEPGVAAGDIVQLTSLVSVDDCATLTIETHFISRAEDTTVFGKLQLYVSLNDMISAF